jgi:TM2 domain-containing membrane protein YozV
MKDRKTYKILTALGLLWILPINRFYLGEKVTFLRLVTLNYCYAGVVADLIYMDKRFDEAMAKRGFTNTDVRNAQGK